MKNYLKIGIGLVLGTTAYGGTVVVDNQINPYTDKTDRQEIVLTQDIPESGESKIELLKERPEMRLKKWNNEVNLGISYPKVKGQGNRDLLSNKIKWKDAKEEVHAYPIDKENFEFEIILKEKPNVNFFDFQIDGAENLDFFYQPPLTAEIGDGRIITANDTQAFDATGRMVESQSENVVGSYAVYHKKKKNHIKGQNNYATGKAFHIYRPKAIDANGTENWAELFYENGILRIIVPQMFLDNAVYPIRIDPTFGYTSIGGTDDTWTTNDTIIFSQDSGNNLTENGDITKLTGYGAAVSGTIGVKGIMHDNGDPPGLLRGVTTATNFTTTLQWWDMNFSSSVSLSAGSYAIGYALNGDVTFKKDNTAGYSRHSASGSYASPASPFSSTSYSKTASRRESFYATYTVSTNNPSVESNIIFFE